MMGREALCTSGQYAALFNYFPGNWEDTAVVAV